MKDPQLSASESHPGTKQTCQEIQQSLRDTRSTMARQDLLKKLWHLETDEKLDTEFDGPSQAD